MYKYVCIHCGNVNFSEYSIEDYLNKYLFPVCSFCGAGVFDLFDFNEHTKDIYCSSVYKEGRIKILTFGEFMDDTYS